MNTGRPSNPFSSHLVEPDRGGYMFGSTAEFQNLQQVLDKLKIHGWRGELLGHEGVGKSTLLTDICSALEQCGHTVIRWRTNDECRALPRGWVHELKRHDIVAIDGAERLWPWLLCAVRVMTKRQKKGLIITTHNHKGLGAKISLKADAATLAHKVSTLTGQPASADEIAKRLQNHDGNAREVFFDLYMEYEHSSPNQ